MFNMTILSTPEYLVSGELLHATDKRGNQIVPLSIPCPVNINIILEGIHLSGSSAAQLYCHPAWTWTWTGIVPDPNNNRAIIMRIATEHTITVPYIKRIWQKVENNHPDSKTKKRVQGQWRRGSCN